MTICSALFLSYYWIVLRNKRFHYYNRFYLLLCVVLSIVLPLLNLQWFTFKSNSEKTIRLFNVIYGSRENDIIINGNSSLINWQQLLTMLLFSISACLLFILVLRILKLYRFKKIYPVNTTSEFNFINTDLKQAPFSFLKNIFWRNDISIGEPTGQQILQHELTHVKQKHTFDKLFMQIILSVFWMNPFYWLIRSELYFIHEFIADEKAVNNKDASAFAAMLLHAQFGKTIFSPAQSFFYSPIKRRLLMLTTSKQSRLSYTRRILTLPLLATVLLLFSCTLQKENDMPIIQGDTMQTFKFTPPKIVADTNFVTASFPGGHDAWQKFLEQNLNSNIPVDKGSPPGTYKVIVSFLVDANGKVSNVKAINNPGYGTAEEAVRVIANGPDWVAAKNNNSPVSSMVKQDITFQVSEQ